jgi:VWFA-related protein
MRHSRVLLSAVLLIFPATFTYGQQRETTTVEVVQVPVSVMKAGVPVPGLTRDDFQLWVNGKPQKIDYFDVIDFSALSAEQSRDPRQRRLYVLVFDIANSAPFAILRAKQAAEQYLAAAQPSDYFAVAILSSTDSVRLIVPFTRDQTMLRRAVAILGTSSSDDPLKLTVTPAERAIFVNNDSAEIAELRRVGGSLAAELAMEASQRRAEDALDGLGQLAERLAPLEGYKHVILLSNGFATSRFLGGTPLDTDFTAGGSSTAGFYQRQTKPQTMQSTRPQQLQRFASGFGLSGLGFQQQMQKKFTAAGVMLDAIDLNGVPAPFDRTTNDSLHFVVADTGGQVVEHRNNLLEAMQRLTDSEQIVYFLGFHAPYTGHKRNDISVHVDGAPRGSTVKYRQSYASLSAKPSSDNGLLLADIISNDIPQNGIGMTATVAATPKQATVNIKLPGRELLGIAGDDAKTTGEALIYIFSGQTSVAFARKAIDIETAQARSSGLDTGGVEMTQSFDLPPGTYAMKVLVRIDGRDALAFARRDFTVGD